MNIQIMKYFFNKPYKHIPYNKSLKHSIGFMDKMYFRIIQDQKNVIRSFSLIHNYEVLRAGSLHHSR
jgi:hypothetical protein